MAFSKTFVVRTQSGKTMSFDDYRRQLAKLSTSEKGRRMGEKRGGGVYSVSSSKEDGLEGASSCPAKLELPRLLPPGR